MKKEYPSHDEKREHENNLDARNDGDKKQRLLGECNRLIEAKGLRAHTQLAYGKECIWPERYANAEAE